MNSPGRTSEHPRLLTAAIGGGVVLVAAAVSIYITFFKGPADLARATADGIHEVFNVMPHVMIDETVVLEDESGWWNKVSPGDRDAAVMHLTDTARGQARSSGLLAEAQRTARTRITDILERNGARAAFIQRTEGTGQE